MALRYKSFEEFQEASTSFFGKAEQVSDGAPPGGDPQPDESGDQQTLPADT